MLPVGSFAGFAATADFAIHEGAVEAAEVAQGCLGRTGFEEEVMPGDVVVVFDASMAVVHASEQESVMREEREGLPLRISFGDEQMNLGWHGLREWIYMGDGERSTGWLCVAESTPTAGTMGALRAQGQSYMNCGDLLPEVGGDKLVLPGGFATVATARNSLE